MPSTVIRSYSYNAATETLSVVFLSGRLYNYLHVPVQVYEAMMASFSKGTFFNKEIKDKYVFERG